MPKKMARIDSKPEKTKNASKQDSIPEVITLFTKQLRSFEKALSPTMTTLRNSCVSHGKKMDAFVESHGINKKKQDGHMAFELKEEDAKKFEKLADEVTSYVMATRNVPIAFLVALVSQFDAYLSNLLRSLFYLKPELLNASQRQLTFSELMAFPSLDAARDHVIEKEVESILRSSHVEQFEWMESRFGVPLRKDLPIWPQFVELTERRNLFVHCDGVVSSQYVAICQKHDGLPDERVCVGDALNVEPKYFSSAYQCLFELGVKLGHVLWRKMCPNELEAADEHLNSLCFDLLVEEKYGLAKVILHFATNTLKKHSSDIERRVFVINHAIALKHLKEDSFKTLLANEDWSACRQEFQLAVAVLHDEYSKAALLMGAIGSTGKPGEQEYRTWPLFREFRCSQEFRKAYFELFGKEFMVEETAESPKKSRTSRSTKEPQTIV
ncbi:MAG: hypothetical protein HGA99_10465 [Chlorobiaceae bacterium]|nr:hypothetical protein [Chlorobiaceae bacterium]